MSDSHDDEMRTEYDLAALNGRVQGKYAHAIGDRPGAVVVALDPDVARVFPDATAVNEALRTLIEAEPTGRT